MPPTLLAHACARTLAATRLRRQLLLPTLFLASGLACIAHAGDLVQLWDTGSRLDKASDLANRASWHAVPTELFHQEKDPVKAASDPGYYGRAYRFQGDAVLENPACLIVARMGADGLVIFAKAPSGAPGNPTRLAEVLPGGAGASGFVLDQVEILRNADDEVKLQLLPKDPEKNAARLQIALDRSPLVTFLPSAQLATLRVESRLACGVAPGFGPDDLIYAASSFPEGSALEIPSDRVAVGLLEGGQHALTFTWPGRDRETRWVLGSTDAGRQLTAFTCATGGDPLYIGIQSAPGLWHRETLGAGFLEKDKKLSWQPPFPARWQTQLYETDVRTTFRFRTGRQEIWRGVVGGIIYPAWIQGSDAFLRLGKKVLPKGDAVFYALEPSDTPGSVMTPFDLVQSALGRVACAEIFDTAARQLRTHHRRAGDGVHRACTCGCTEVIQAMFDKGEEVKCRDQIQGALDDMLFFVDRHLQRIDEYLGFARSLSQQLGPAATAHPEGREYFQNLASITAEFTREYEAQKELMKSKAHAETLLRQTLALTDKQDPANLKASQDVLKAWRDMGGAQDYVLARFHMLARKISQEAGYGCARHPALVPVARQVRSQCQQILRNPDGYEIWADY